MAEPDILADCASRLKKAGLESAVVNKVIAELRRTYAGTECYIHAIDRKIRDAAIVDALNTGLPIDEVAKKVQCHSSTVRRVKSDWLL